VGNRLAVFTTSDNGASFGPTIMTVSGLSNGETRGGVTFGSGNTFFTKDAGGTTLRYGTFDLGTPTAAVTATSTLPTGRSGFSELT
jgi:hypothetical protein